MFKCIHQTENKRTFRKQTHTKNGINYVRTRQCGRECVYTYKKNVQPNANNKSENKYTE